jgi:hypothetical protein
MGDDYQISEEDIDVMLKNLEFSDPKNATRENAKAKLDEIQAGLRGIAQTDPEKFFKIKNKIDKPDQTQ